MTRWEKCNAIFNPVFWRTVPKAIGWLAIASVFALLVKAVALDQIPAPFQWMSSIGDVVSGLLNSIVASAIFYLVANHYDEVRLWKIYGPRIATHLRTVWEAFGTMLWNLDLKAALTQEEGSDSSHEKAVHLSSNLSSADFTKLLVDRQGTEPGPIFSIKCLEILQMEIRIYSDRVNTMQALIHDTGVLNGYLNEELREKLAEYQRLRAQIWALVSGDHQGGTSETLANYIYHYYSQCLALRAYIKNHPFYGA